jgi:signal transduction histidine kinase
VAATGSDAKSSRRRVRSGVPRRLSLRLRLTLLYGACFLLASGAVLALTYVLVAHDAGSQTRQLYVHGTKIQLPSSPLTVEPGQSSAAARSSGRRGRLMIQQIHVSPNGTETITWGPPGATSRARRKVTIRPRYSAAQLARIQTGALAMSRCMRAHGLSYPDLEAVYGPGGLEIGFPRDRLHLFNANLASRAFKAANVTCSPLLDRAIPGDGSPDKRIASSLQKQVNVIVDRANGALATQRSRSLHTLLTWSGVALGVMAVISILLGWLVGGRALRPLRTMTSKARRITEKNLHERLSADAGEDELGELANTFDGVLARLERVFEAHKRFVANASHELRTPVTLERALLEIALAGPADDAETLRRTCERVLASTKQQQQTIDALLTLARSQGGTDVDAPVNLADLAEDAITLRERRLEDITVAADLHPAPLSGDPALLERLVANLLDNAIIHNRAEDAWITVETGNEGTGSWLRVSNSGPDVPEAMLSEIFEPFRRMDGERTATATGLGLGLSIVRAIADVHGAAIVAGPVAGGGLRVEVRF